MPVNAYKAKKGQIKAAVKKLPDQIGFRIDELADELEGLFNALGNSPTLFDALFAEMITGLFESIQLDTPWKTGTARSAWRMNKFTKDTETHWVISNGVHYIVYLELGTSKKRPFGMVRKNLDRFIVDAREATKDLLKSKRFLK